MTEWIATAERQPDDEGRYLVVVLNAGCTKKRIQVGTYKMFHHVITTGGDVIKRPLSNQYWTGSGITRTESVLYWMPLPEAPKADDDNG